MFAFKKNINYSILPCFAFPVLGIFWPAYLVALIHVTLQPIKNFLKSEYKCIVPVCIFIFFKFIQSPTFNTFLFFKTFIGFYFFYFYFRYFNRANLEKIIIAFTSFYIFIEWVYKIAINKEQFARRVWAIAYPRPVGLAENATIMSTILIVYLLIFSKKLDIKWSRYLVFDVLVSCSGMGFVGLIYFYFRTRIKWILNNKLKTIIIFSSLISFYFVMFNYVLPEVYSGNPLYKISPQYIFFLITNKIELVFKSTSKLSNASLLMFGFPWNGKFQYVGSDFGWLDIFLMSGLVGLGINIFLINKLIQNSWIKFFLILSIFHYGAIWWPAGQIFLGYAFGHKEEADHQLDKILS